MEEIETQGTHWINYADGTYAEYQRKEKVTGEDGIKRWVFILFPPDELKMRYNLKEGEELDHRGRMIQEYPETNVHVCRDDPNFSRVWIFTKFDGEPTSMSDRYIELTEQIRVQEKIIMALRASNARLEEENEMTYNQALKKAINDVKFYKEVLKIKGSEPREEYGERGPSDVPT